MDAFPAFLPLAGRTVVIIGSGEPADAKARLFDGAPARLVRSETPDAGLLANAALIFIALPAGAALDEAVSVARAAGGLVNVVDRPDLSDFTTPSIVDRGPVVGAIGTDGAAPVLATRLRQQLEALWPQGLGTVASLLKSRQSAIRARFPDLVSRRRFLRQVLDGEIAALALAGGDAGPALDAAIESGEAGVSGSVWRLEVGASAETLMLGELRRLGAADRIVLEGTIPDDILAFARRDALRETGATEDDVARWAAAGERVCRLVRT